MSPKTIAFLPSEAMTIILRYLDGSHTTRLYETGDKSLIYNLTTRGDVKEFRWEWNRGTEFVWPPIISKFPLLESLSLSVPQYYRDLPVRDTRALELPKTLRSLKLGFMNAASALCEVVSGPKGPKLDLVDLNRIYPNLTRLKYAQPLQKTCLNLNVAHLPSMLVSCSLVEAISPSNIGLLPRALQTLKCVVSSEKGPLNLNLPPNLITLVLHRLSCATAFKFIPISVRDLTISFESDQDDWEKSDETNCFGLPWLRCTDLHSLRIESIFGIDFIDDNAFALVPMSVTSLSITLDRLVWGSARFIRRLSLLHHPEHFIHLVIGSSEEPDSLPPRQAIDYKCFSQFTGLQVFNPPRWFNSGFIPDHLIEVTLNRLNRVQSNGLPSTLKRLKVEIIFDRLDNEPSITDDDSEPPSDDDDDDSLNEPYGHETPNSDGKGKRNLNRRRPPVWTFPPSLSSVHISNSITIDALEQLLHQSINLTSLKCIVTEGGNLANLPPSLQNLDFGLHYEYSLVPLPNLPNLSHLKLELRRGDPIDHDTLQNFVKSLESNAPSLKRFDITGQGIQGSILSHFTNSAFKLLQHLSIELNSLKNDDFPSSPLSLPSDLTSLNLTSNNSARCYITPEVLSVLPKGLITLRIPAFMDSPSFPFPSPSQLGTLFPFLQNCNMTSIAQAKPNLIYREFMSQRLASSIAKYYHHHPPPSSSL